MRLLVLVQGGTNKMEYCTDYKLHQYESYSEKGLFPLGERVNARYIKQTIPEHQGNPLIEALTPTYSTEQLVNIMQRLPYHSVNERNENIEYKIHAIKRLYHYHFVVPDSIEVANKFSMIIKGGYESRNITTPDYIRRMNLTSDVINHEWLDSITKEPVCIYNNSYNSNPGTTVVGTSGNGKSNTVEAVLMTYPQSIMHEQYGGRNFKFPQLVWLKVNCVPDDELKGMCQMIFKQMDQALKTNYTEKFANSRYGKIAMVVKLHELFRKHALGVLVVDELQFLSSARVGSNEILKFFINMEGELKIPIVYIGTNDIINKVFGSQLYGLRKASGIGEIVFTNMLNKDKLWDIFVENMWRFQWTNEYLPLDEEIKEMLYRKSAGIKDRLIKLFMATQLYAIIHKKSRINLKIIEEVAEKYFPLTKHYIQKMVEVSSKKTKDGNSDLPPEDIDELLKEAELKARNEERLEEIRAKNEYKENLKKDDIVNEVIYSLIKFGFSDAFSKKVAHSVVDKHGTNKSPEFIMQQVAKEIKNIDKSMEGKQKKEKTINKTEVHTYDDVKDEIDNLIGYDNLNEKGKIKGIDEFMN